MRRIIFHHAFIGLGLLGVSIALLFTASCSGNNDPIIADESGDSWSRSNGFCVRQSSEGPMMRVINRTDPELCGIKIKIRPKEFVRVLPRK